MTVATGAGAARRSGAFGWLGVALLIGVFLLSWGGALILTAPAGLVRVPAGMLPGNMTLTPVTGTIWQGQWRLNLPQGDAWAVTARFRPAALWHGRLDWRIRIQGDGVSASADVSPGWSGVAIDGLTARWAGDAMRLVTAWPMGGRFDGRGAVYLRRTQQGLMPESGSLSLRWTDAQLTTTEPLTLGTLTLSTTLADGGRLSGRVTPEATSNAPLLGQLDLKGNIHDPQHIRVTGFLQPTAEASPALRQQLGLLGTTDAQGRIPVNGFLPGA